MCQFVVVVVIFSILGVFARVMCLYPLGRPLCILVMHLAGNDGGHIGILFLHLDRLPVISRKPTHQTQGSAGQASVLAVPSDGSAMTTDYRPSVRPFVSRLVPATGNSPTLGATQKSAAPPPRKFKIVQDKNTS